MNIVCLDMEGVLVPEIWIAFAEESGIPELRRTTRDEPDYDKLMRWRIDTLRQHGLGLPDIQNTIRRIDPLPGAREFLDRLRTKAQVVILSDTFEQFGLPLMEKLNWPTLLCNTQSLQSQHRPGLPVHGLRYHRLRRQLQRFGDDPGQQGGLPVPHHGADQGGLCPVSGLRGVWRSAGGH